jgi:hypothetical protein
MFLLVQPAVRNPGLIVVWTLFTTLKNMLALQLPLVEQSTYLSDLFLEQAMPLKSRFPKVRALAQQRLDDRRT